MTAPGWQLVLGAVRLEDWRMSGRHGVRIRVLEPCGPPEEGVFVQNLAALRAAGLVVDYQPYDVDAGERLGASGVAARLRQLREGLVGDGYDYLLAARGGYGASDLLGRLDWDQLERMSPRPLVGFSDFSALQSAFYTRLGWPALHAPMPGSPLWNGGPDIEQLLALLVSGRPWSGSISVQPLDKAPAEGVTGTLYGGCLSVLTNLIGTPYMPGSLAGHLLFFEDTNEAAARLLRAWNQWLDSGLLTGVTAVVLGRFTQMGAAQSESWLGHEIAERTGCPVYYSTDFGHVTPNYPLALGATAQIVSGKLQWSLD